MKVVQLDFGKIIFEKNYVISEINSGIDLEVSEVDELIKVIQDEFGENPYVLISNRINDYSLNPSESRRVANETPLKAAAFVLKRQFSFNSFQSERIFYKVPTQAFNNIEDAIEWAMSYFE